MLAINAGRRIADRAINAWCGQGLVEIARLKHYRGAGVPQEILGQDAGYSGYGASRYSWTLLPYYYIYDE